MHRIISPPKLLKCIGADFIFIDDRYIFLSLLKQSLNIKNNLRCLSIIYAAYMCMGKQMSQVSFTQNKSKCFLLSWSFSVGFKSLEWVAYRHKHLA